MTSDGPTSNCENGENRGLLAEGLRASQTYAFTVSAVDAAGNQSALSPTLRVTLPPGDSQAPTTPGQPVASELAATSVQLAWSHSTDNIKLNRYDILRVTDAGNQSALSPPVTVTTLPPAEPAPACTVRHRVGSQWPGAPTPNW